MCYQAKGGVNSFLKSFSGVLVKLSLTKSTIGIVHEQLQ